jgi:hypothetical protein
MSLLLFEVSGWQIVKDGDPQMTVQAARIEQGVQNAIHNLTSQFTQV